MGVKVNRCSGCTEFDGFYGVSVICKLGTNASIDRGCSKFNADIDASCLSGCYYYGGRTKTIGNYICNKYNEEYQSEQQYCSGYAEKWDDMSSERSGCFPAGTKILVSNNRSADISSLKKNDYVLSITDDNKITRERVIRIKRYKKRKLWKISFVDGSSLITTGSHSFSKDGRWVKASKLTPGDMLTEYENGILKNKEIVASCPLRSIDDVYNIVVERNYRFIANGIVSHSFTAFRSIRVRLWDFYSFVVRGFFYNRVEKVVSLLGVDK